jgi:hypothetical protein
MKYLFYLVVIIAVILYRSDVIGPGFGFSVPETLALLRKAIVPSV